MRLSFGRRRPDRSSLPRSESHKDASNNWIRADGNPGFIAAGVAHEINNPLTYLNPSIDELKQSLPVVRKEIRSHQPNDSYSSSTGRFLFENLDIICTPSRLEELEKP